MNNISLAFPRSKGAAPFGIVVGMVIGAFGIIVTLNIRGAPGMESGAYLPVLITVPIGLVVIIGSIASFLDDAPKLSADANGMTDHRATATVKQISWITIQSIDLQMDQYRSNLIVCYTSSDGRLNSTLINIGGLQGGTMAVFTAIKEAWLEFKKSNKN